MEERDEKKIMEDGAKAKKQEIQQLFKSMAQFTASYFTICDLIAQKITPGFHIHKSTCFFENGFLNFLYLDSDTILTTINLGKVELGSEFKKVLKKFDESMKDILDFRTDE